MILDSSAIVAIILGGPDALALERTLARDPYRGVAAPTVLETGLVLASRLGGSSELHLTAFLVESGAAVIPFGERHWPVALDGFRRFGKGRHPASLNFGDCVTYATAKVAGEPLLCVGSDFAHTDLTLAM